MEIIMILVLVFVVAGIAIFAMDAKKRRQSTDALSSIPDFTPTHMQLGSSSSDGIAIDVERRKVCLLTNSRGQQQHRIVGFGDIIGSEIHEDGHTVSSASRTSQVGGAVVGGVLLGGVGAVIGGLSGKKRQDKKASKIELRLVINDLAMPTHTVTFLHITVDRSGLVYTQAAQSAQQWQARMEALIRQAEQDHEAAPVSSPSAPSTNA